eukprot:Polyplicarium_translucidae@DN3210_c0_g1_i9.p2
MRSVLLRSRFGATPHLPLLSRKDLLSRPDVVHMADDRAALRKKVYLVAVNPDHLQGSLGTASSLQAGRRNPSTNPGREGSACLAGVGLPRSERVVVTLLLLGLCAWSSTSTSRSSTSTCRSSTSGARWPFQRKVRPVHAA